MHSAPASRNTRSKRLPAPPTDEITLRLIGTEQHGRIVRITSAKCTVGSAPGCTLRLKANGVAPLHCLILRGTNGVVVRRLAEDALLNGRPFDDAPLAADDRLEIGSVAFVVVQVPLSPQAPEEVEDAGPEPITEDARELVRETRRQARRRARNLLNALRAGKRQTEQLTRLIESRKSELEQTARQTVLLHRELAAQRDRQRTVEDEQRAAVLQVGQLTASLDRLRHELLAAQSQRQSEADRWRLDRSRMTEDLALRDSRLHEAESQLQQKQWELEQLHLQFQRQQRQLELEHEQAVAARQRRDRDAESAQLEIGRISEELLAQDRARLQAESELQSARRELEQLRDGQARLRKEAADDRAALQAERETRGGQVTALETTLADERTLTAKLRAEVQSRATELEQLRATAEKNVREWQLERLQILKEVSQAAAHDAQLLTEHRKQLDEAAEKSRALETQLADQRAAAATREAELAAIREELEKERRERQSERNKLLDSEQSVARIVGLTEDSRRKLNETEAQRLRLETLLAEREAELLRLRDENRSHTIQWTATREQLSEVETTANERMLAAEAALTAARDDAARQAVELENRLAAEAEAKAQFEAQLEQLRAELSDVKSRDEATMFSLAAAQEEAERQKAELEIKWTAECAAKTSAEQEIERLRQELTELDRRASQTMILTKSAAEEEAARREAELTARIAAESASKEQAEHEAERLRQELCELRSREMQTMVFQSPAPEVPVVETPAVDPEQLAALEQQRQELAEREARLAQLQQELAAERDVLATEAARAQEELRNHQEHLAAESSRLSAGMHQLQEFELRLVRQQDEFARRQREQEERAVTQSIPVAVCPPAVDDEESKFLMPADATPGESDVAPPPVASYLPVEPQQQFLEPTEPEILEPVAEETIAVAPRMVTEPYFVPQAAAESSFLEPQDPATEEPTAEAPPVEETQDQPAKSSAFERRLAALAAEAAKARAAVVDATPEREPILPEEPAAEDSAPVEMLNAPAMTPDLLPQWRFEHETPERMDTIAGLRMRNLLDEIKSFPADAGMEEEPSKTLAEMISPPSARPAFVPQPTPQPEPTPEPVAEAPAEEIDIFSRLKEAGILKGDPVTPITMPPREESVVRSYLPTPESLQEEEPEPTAEAYGSSERVDQTTLLDPTELPNPFAAKKAEPVSEEEDSIENYMQQLLQRVRGDGPPTGTGVNPVYRAAAAPQSSPLEPSTKKSTPITAPKPDLTPVKPEEYVPRSTAPEHSVNLAAMRELANSQARSAIHTHQKKVGLQLSGGKLITAVVALIAGGVLIWAGYTNHIRLSVGAGGLGVVIGLYWLMQALFLSQGWVKSMQRAIAPQRKK